VNLNMLPEQLILSIGATCGPTFVIIDGYHLDHAQVCYDQILQGIPEEILHVTQVIMILTPDQLKKHQPPASHTACNLQAIDLETIPEDHLILRSWFPPLSYQENVWKEASISIGGLLVAGKYLQQKRQDVASSWKFSSWSLDWSLENGGWERFEVSTELDGRSRITCYREEYRAPKRVYDSTLDALKNYFLENEREKILEGLHHQLLQDQSNNLFSTFQAAPISLDNGYYLDIAFIPDQSASRDEYEHSFLIVPFIPVFVGELHYVVPVGDFSVEYFGNALESVLKELSLKEYRLYYELYELFDYEDNIIDLLSNIGIWRDQWEESAHVGSEHFIKKYPGGWTFLKDEEKEKTAPIDFITVEPGYQKHPVWSNSGSGALAAAIVQDLLHPGDREQTYEMKGWTQSMETTWIERAFKQHTLGIRKRSDGLWEVRAPVRMLGEYRCTGDNLEFVRGGRN
jgi:hypothetical protein